MNVSPHDEYNPDTLIGFAVVTTGNETIGSVTGILYGVANDNLIVGGASGEILIPVITDVIISIDASQEIIIIEPMEGLLELNVKKQKNDRRKKRS